MKLKKFTDFEKKEFQQCFVLQTFFHLLRGYDKEKYLKKLQIFLSSFFDIQIPTDADTRIYINDDSWLFYTLNGGVIICFRDGREIYNWDMIEEEMYKLVNTEEQNKLLRNDDNMEIYKLYIKTCF